MKKITILLVLSLLFSCTFQNEDNSAPLRTTGGETVADGLEWYDVVYPFFVSGNDNGATFIAVDANEIMTDDDSGYIAMIEFDDTNDYVGAIRGTIEDGDQFYVYEYYLQIKSGYDIKVTKGKDITLAQFNQAVNNIPDGMDCVYWYGPKNDYATSGSFYFSRMTDYRNIAIGSELALLEVYHSTANFEGEPVSLFKIVL